MVNPDKTPAPEPNTPIEDTERYLLEQELRSSETSDERLQEILEHTKQPEESTAAPIASLDDMSNTELISLLSNPDTPDHVVESILRISRNRKAVRNLSQDG